MKLFPSCSFVPVEIAVNDGDESKQMSFGLYLVGCVIAISGLVYGAVLLHGAKATRQKDPGK
jgi:hypothetical protein